MQTYCSLFTSFLVVITGALAGVVAARYFAIQAALPGASSKLIGKIEETIGWLSPPPGASVHGTKDDVPQETMDAFLACTWPWQKRSLEKAWAAYQSGSPDDEKARRLQVLLGIVRGISGRNV